MPHGQLMRPAGCSCPLCRGVGKPAAPKRDPRVGDLFAGFEVEGVAPPPEPVEEDPAQRSLFETEDEDE